MLRWKEKCEKSSVTDAVSTVFVLLLQRCAVEGTTEGREKKITTLKLLNLTL